MVELSQLDKNWLLKVKTILSKLLYVVKAEDVEEIFKELKAEVDKLDKDKREKFYSYLKSLLIEGGLSVKEATETVQELEEEGEGKGMIKILEKEWKRGKKKEGLKGDLKAYLKRKETIYTKSSKHDLAMFQRI